MTSEQRRILGSLVLALCLLARAGFTVEQARAAILLVALAATGDAAASAAALPALVLVAFARSLARGAAGSPADLQVRDVLAELALALPAAMVALGGRPLGWRGQVRAVAAHRA